MEFVVVLLWVKGLMGSLDCIFCAFTVIALDLPVARWCWMRLWPLDKPRSWADNMSGHMQVVCVSYRLDVLVNSCVMQDT